MWALSANRRKTLCNHTVVLSPAAVAVRRRRVFCLLKKVLQKQPFRSFVPAAALLLIIGLWNGVRSFWRAYLQALLFLEVMNWYDGIVIDKVWVGYSKFWALPGCEDLPYVQTWTQVLKKRGMLTLIWVVGAAVVAGLVVLIF